MQVFEWLRLHIKYDTPPPVFASELKTYINYYNLDLSTLLYTLADIPQSLVPFAMDQGACDHVVDALLRNGASPNLNPAEMGGATECFMPVQQAIWQNKPQLLQRLIAANGDPNICLFDGQNALHVAAMIGSAEMASILVPHMNDIDAEYEFVGMTALGLLIRGVQVTDRFRFSQEQRMECFKLLLQAGASPLKGRKPTVDALFIHRGCYRALELCLQHGLDPSCIKYPDQSMTLLTGVVHGGWFDSFLLLLDAGLRPTEEEVATITSDGLQGFVAMSILATCTERVEAPPRVHDGTTALHVAADLVSHRAVRRLLDHGHFVDAHDERGDTPLVYVMRQQDRQVNRNDPSWEPYRETIRTLLAYGAAISPIVFEFDDGGCLISAIAELRRAGYAKRRAPI